jgi:hypothetical protein
MVLSRFTMDSCGYLLAVSHPALDVWLICYNEKPQEQAFCVRNVENSVLTVEN